MKLLATFIGLPRHIKALVLEATVLLLLARLLVDHVRLGRWRRYLNASPMPISAGGPAPRALGRKIGRIVSRLAPHMPFTATCLLQAIAAQWMLRRRGAASELMIGARRTTEDGDLDLHAWLTVDGRCVVGGHQVETYSALPPLGSAAQ